MKIEYKCKKIKRLLKNGPTKSGVPQEIVEALKIKLQYLEACTDERDIRNAKSLHYEKLEGRNGLQSIRINKKWRLIIDLRHADPDPRIVVYGVEDYH